MSDLVELTCYIVGFFTLGMLINHTGNSLYWLWVDWKHRRENK